MTNQISNFKNNTNIMTNNNIRELWKNFTIKYKNHFMSNK